MKKRFLVSVTAVAIFGLMASFATVAQAYPSKTVACTGCHSGVNVPVTAAAGTVSGTTVSYSFSAPTASAIALFDGATKVATLGSTGTYSATIGTAYTAYAVAGPTMSSGIGSTTFTPSGPTAPGVPAAPSLNATYNTATGNITIAWPAVSGATSYDYQVGTGAIASTAGTSVSLSGLALGNTAFKVRATNGTGSSAYTSTTIVYAVPVVPDGGTVAKVKLHLKVSHKYAKRLTATITNNASGAKITARVDRKGNVTFRNVPVGTYRLTVSGSKRVKFRAKTIVVSAQASKQHHDD